MAELWSSQRWKWLEMIRMQLVACKPGSLALGFKVFVSDLISCVL